MTNLVKKEPALLKITRNLLFLNIYILISESYKKYLEIIKGECFELFAVKIKVSKNKDVKVGTATKLMSLHVPICIETSHSN